MTFYKPKNITFTQMAQWVDSHHMLSDCDENTLCQYIYHLVVLRAQQCSMFKEQEQLDDFALYCTSRLLQKIQKDRATSTNIKSISNYIRTVISPWKADYISAFCTGSSEYELADFDVTDFSDYLIDTTSYSDYNSYWFECINTSDVIRKHLKQIPKKKHSAEWLNIYISCLLTLKNRLDVANIITKQKQLKDPQLVDKLIRSTRKLPPILYHVDESKSNYIAVLVNEITHAIAAELTHSTASKVSVSACMRNLVIAASNEEED